MLHTPRNEGVEIFSPNHFADLYSAGFGMVSALNSNVISNSDFFVSIFNANYKSWKNVIFVPLSTWKSVRK